MVSLIQHFETDFLWKVSLKILNSGIILKTFTPCIYKNYDFDPLNSDGFSHTDKCNKDGIVHYIF